MAKQVVVFNQMDGREYKIAFNQSAIRKHFAIFDWAERYQNDDEPQDFDKKDERAFWEECTFKTYLGEPPSSGE